MPKISVIVPVYNTEEYLSRCIDSILSQTFTDFELILINDGSTDNSGRICDEYVLLDKRVTVIHKENGGVSSARNKGLNISKGEFITFIDSDDWIELYYLDQFLQENVDFQICGYNQLISYPSLCKPDATRNVYLNDIANVFDVEFYKLYCRGILSKCFKKEIIDKYHLAFNQNLRIGEDTLFILQYLSHCKSIRFISNYGYNYACIYEINKYKLSVNEYYQHITVLNNAVNECNMAFKQPFTKSKRWLNRFFYYECLIHPLKSQSLKTCVLQMKLYRKLKLYKYAPIYNYNYKEMLYFWLSIYFPRFFYENNTNM